MSHKGTLKFPDAQILVFARAPVSNTVKTRLIPDLGADTATQLYRAMLQQTVSTAASEKLCSVKLLCTPDCEHSFFQSLKSRYSLELDKQQGKDLGERMFNAAVQALQVYKHVILIGCDCLQLTESHLHETLIRLSSNDGEVVITPALDGGYVLLGLSQVRQELFNGIDWGTGRVMEQTRGALEGLGWSWREEKPLRDLDTLEDLKQLMHHEHQYLLDAGVRNVLDDIDKRIDPNIQE